MQHTSRHKLTVTFQILIDVSSCCQVPMYALVSSYLPYSWGEDSYPRVMGNTGNLMLDSWDDSSLLVLGMKQLHTTKGHLHVVLRNKANSHSLQEASFVPSRGRESPGSQQRQWLTCFNNSMGWQRPEALYPDIRMSLCLISMIRRIVWLQGQSWKGNLWWGYSRFS